MSTYSQKPSEVTRKWHVIDASSAPLGRIASAAAKKLIGKEKPTYTPHIDGGDYVVIINAENLVVTGASKPIEKKYYRHSGHPGSLKTATLKEQKAKNPNKVVEEAVKGMIPRNKLHSDRMARLKVYSGSEHNHEAQKPGQWVPLN